MMKVTQETAGELTLIHRPGASLLVAPLIMALALAAGLWLATHGEAVMGVFFIVAGLAVGLFLLVIAAESTFLHASRASGGLTIRRRGLRFRDEEHCPLARICRAGLVVVRGAWGPDVLWPVLELDDGSCLHLRRYAIGARPARAAVAILNRWLGVAEDTLASAAETGHP